jgi:hypothetical protein
MGTSVSPCPCPDDAPSPLLLPLPYDTRESLAELPLPLPLPLLPPTGTSLTPPNGVSLVGASRAAPRPDTDAALPPLLLPPLPEPEPLNDAPKDVRDSLGLPLTLTVPLFWWLLPPTGNGGGNDVAGAAATGMGGSLGRARPERFRLTRGPAPLSDGSGIVRITAGLPPKMSSWNWKMMLTRQEMRLRAKQPLTRHVTATNCAPRTPRGVARIAQAETYFPPGAGSRVPWGLLSGSQCRGQWASPLLNHFSTIPESY